VEPVTKEVLRVREELTRQRNYLRAAGERVSTQNNR